MEFELKSGSWFELRDRCVLRLSGPDRVRYLNGQVTNDVSQNLDGRAIPACICSVKGKVEALVWITAEPGEDALLIDGELSQREFLQERLDRYLIADDCEWEDVTGEYRLVHVLDRCEGKESTRLFTPGTDLWLKKGDKISLDPALELSAEQFERSELLSLIPKADFEITGEDFPAELGLDESAVNFTKGCYLGQEIVSRIRSAGRIRYKLTLIVAEKEIPRDSKVRIAPDEGGKLTRATEYFGEKLWVAPALIRENPKLAQLVEIPFVTRLKRKLVVK